MVIGHRQQSTKRVLEEMMVGNSQGDENRDCNGNGNGDSIDNDANADAVYC